MTIEQMISVLKQMAESPQAGFTQEEIRKGFNEVASLLTAQKEGRLAVMPCSIGDKIYIIKKKIVPCLYDVDVCHHSNGRCFTTAEAASCDWHCPGVYEIKEHICEGFEVKDKTKPLTLEDTVTGLECFWSDVGWYRTREEAEDVVRLLVGQAEFDG